MNEITIETATVYRGGGRRWFTKSAAIHAEAKAAYNKSVKAKGLCECGSQFIHGYGEVNDYCRYHDRTEPVYGRYIRYAEHCIKKVSHA